MQLFTTNHPFALLILVLQLVATVASAQDTVPDKPDVSSNVNTEAEDSELRSGTVSSVRNPFQAAPITMLYRFRVQSPDTTHRIEVRSVYDAPIARCLGRCVLRLPKGSYKAVFLDANERALELDFSVEGAGGVELQDVDQTASSVGLALGVAGPILIVTGMVLMIQGLKDACLMSECSRQHESGEAGLFLGGFGALLAGAIMTPIGWVKYARNRRPRLRGLSMDWSVGAAPTNDGVLVGLVGRF